MHKGHLSVDLCVRISMKTGPLGLVNSLRHIWVIIGPSLVRTTACLLVNVKRLLKPMATYCQLDPWEHLTSGKYWWKYSNLYWHKRIWKYRLPNGGYFVHSLCVKQKPYRSRGGNEIDIAHQQRLSLHIAEISECKLRMKWLWSAAE